MNRKRHIPEQIFRKLKEADRMPGELGLVIPARRFSPESRSQRVCADVSRIPIGIHTVPSVIEIRRTEPRTRTNSPVRGCEISLCRNDGFSMAQVFLNHREEVCSVDRLGRVIITSGGEALLAITRQGVCRQGDDQSLITRFP